MRILILIPILALLGCSGLKTPQERYYVLTAAITETGNITEKFVDTCLALPKENACYGKLPAINKGAKALQASAAQLDKVFVSGDSAYYNLSLTVTENALNDLKKVMGN